MFFANSVNNVFLSRWFKIQGVKLLDAKEISTEQNLT